MTNQGTNVKQITLQEGMVKKGGVNPPPKSPKPAAQIVGQTPQTPKGTHPQPPASDRRA